MIGAPETQKRAEVTEPETIYSADLEVIHFSSPVSEELYGIAKAQYKINSEFSLALGKRKDSFLGVMMSASIVAMAPKD